VAEPWDKEGQHNGDNIVLLGQRADAIGLSWVKRGRISGSTGPSPQSRTAIGAERGVLGKLGPAVLAIHVGSSTKSGDRRLASELRIAYIKINW